MAVERADAAQGQTVTLRIAFRQEGVLVDPHEVRQVQILDEDFAVLATTAAGSIVHDSTGRYHVEWFIPSGEPVEVHHDRWYATITDGTCAETQFTLQFFVLPAAAAGGGAPYITVDEARLYLPGETTLSDAQIAEVVALAQETVESITGQYFLPRTEARVFNGKGKAVQEVDPILSVSMIRFRACASEWHESMATDIRIGGSGMMIALGNVLASGYPHVRTNGVTLYAGNGGCGFPAGFQNVEVTGEWGMYREVPRQIKAAVGLLTKYAIGCDDPAGVPSNPLESESVDGDRAFTQRKIFEAAKVHGETGYADVDAILARFIGIPKSSVV